MRRSAAARRGGFFVDGFIGGLALLVGCGETNIAAIVRLRPAYQGVREELQSLVQGLPPLDSPSGDWLTGNPGTDPPLWPPPLHDKECRIYNTEFLTVAQLLNPDAPRAANATATGADFDPVLSGDLLRCLQWTGAHNPLSPTVFGDRGGLGAECEAALHSPYLVILRPVEKTFTRFRMDLFLLDRRDRHQPKIAAAFPLALTGKYRDEDVGSGPWVAAAREQADRELFRVVRTEMQRQLSQLAGSYFQFEDHWLSRAQRGPCTERARTYGVRLPR